MKSEGLRKFMLLGLLFLCSCNAELHSSGFGTVGIGPGHPAWKQNLGRGRVLSCEKGDLEEKGILKLDGKVIRYTCLLYTSPSPRDRQKSRMPSSA